MAGEEFKRLFQIAKESTPGTPVPATRKVYGKGALTRERAIHMVEVQTGNRAMNIGGRIRAVVAGGTLTQPLSADEIIEWLLMGVQGGVTPTTIASTTPTTQPTLSNAATGGTILAGVQTVVYTAVTVAGESQGLTVASTTTTTGSTSTVTVPSVAGGLPAGTTAVNYYLSSPGGGAVTATFAGTNAAGASITLLAPGNGTQFPPAATPTAVQTWVFRATGTTVDTATMEFFDGQRDMQQTGVNVDTISIAGSVEADNEVTVGLFGREMVVNTQTPALADRAMAILEGWEAQLFIDPLGATPGTTNIPGTMISWKIDFSNNLGRKYFADNTTATGAVILGKIGLKAEIVMEANALALAEYTHRETADQRLVRFQFGNNTAVGTGTAKKKIAFDVPCLAGAIDLTGVTNGTATYKFQFEFMNDPTNGWPFQATVVNGRPTAY